jgi:hypothetical protein
MHSIDLKAMCSVYDFKNDFFIEEFDRTVSRAETIRARVKDRIRVLIKKLDTNEDLIQELMKQDRNTMKQRNRNYPSNKRTRFLGVPVDMVDSREAMEIFRGMMKSQGCSLIVTPKSEIIVNATKDPELKHIIEEADLVIPDGSGWSTLPGL